MLEALHDNPTRLAGWLAFAASTAACAWRAAARTKQRGDPWWALAVVQACFFVEIGLGLRFRAHDAFAALLRRHGAYGGRAGLQELLIGLSLALAAAGVVLLLRARQSGREIRLAWLGSAAAAATFAIETISLHRVDALMYAPLGPVKAVAWLWAAAAGAVVLAALWPAGRR